MTLNDEWRDKVYQKLAATFVNDAETLARIMFYLDEEEKEYENQSKISPVWRTMKSSMNNQMFEFYAKRLAEDTKKAEKDAKFRKTMGLMYDQMLTVCADKTDVSIYQKFDFKRFADSSLVQKSGLIGFARAWTMIPLSTQNSILSFIRTYVPNRVLVGQIDEVVGLFNKAGGSLVMVGLAFVTLGYDAIVSINRWWTGQITGVRCCKNIVDSALTTAACVAGSVGGAAIGLLGGPIGAFIGGVVGGIASAQAANYFSDRMTQWIFGIPKEEALENAYNYFGIKINASNHEINTAFRKLCLKHHPDKGGNSEDFLFVQINMAIIKAAKGDL